MGKAAPNAMIDASLAYAAGSDTMYVCSGEPANFAGIASVALADVSVSSGDFTTADHSSGGGRQVTVAAKSAVPIDTSGTATHVVLAKVSDSTLRYVTTCTSQALVSGNTVNIPSWVIAIQDPT